MFITMTKVVLWFRVGWSCHNSYNRLLTVLSTLSVLLAKDDDDHADDDAESGGGSDCDGHDHGYDVYITKAVLTVVVAWQ